MVVTNYKSTRRGRFCRDNLYVGLHQVLVMKIVSFVGAFTVLGTFGLLPDSGQALTAQTAEALADEFAEEAPKA